MKRGRGGSNWFEHRRDGLAFAQSASEERTTVEPRHPFHGVAPIAIALATLIPPASQAQTAADAWHWRASIYGWFPSIGGETRFPSGSPGPTLEVDGGDVIDALKFAFMGSLEARKGRWGAFTDVVYADLGATKSGSRDFTVGRVGLPAGVTANLSLDVKTWGWTFAGTYRIDDSKQNTTDLLFGGRMLYLKQTLDWAFTGDIGSLGLPGASGRSEVEDTTWDAIVGLKGSATLSDDRRWVGSYRITSTSERASLSSPGRRSSASGTRSTGAQPSPAGATWTTSSSPMRRSRT